MVFLVAIGTCFLSIVLVPRAPCVVPWLGRCHAVDMLRRGGRAGPRGSAVIASGETMITIARDVASRRCKDVVFMILFVVSVLPLMAGLEVSTLFSMGSSMNSGMGGSGDSAAEK